jgi:iron(III) transport system permease protein
MDYGIIAAAAVLMVLFVQLLIVLQGRLVGEARKYETVGGKGQTLTPRKLGKTGILISVLLGIYAVITLIVPSIFLVLRSFTGVLTPLVPIAKVLTLENYQAIFGYEQYVRSIYNSLIISIFGGAVAVALTFLGALFAYRTTPGVRSTIERIAAIPRAIPGLIIGLGFFYGMLLFPGGEYLKNTLLILFLAFFIRNFPTGFGAVAPSLLQIGEELDRAARVSGASRWRAIKDVTLPLTRGALGACYVLYFVYFVKEYSSAAFLFGPGSEVIGTTMLQLNFSGFLGYLAALACIELVILMPLTVFIYGKR